MECNTDEELSELFKESYVLEHLEKVDLETEIPTVSFVVFLS